MNARVYHVADTGCSVKPVKNLDWVLDNAKYCDTVTISKYRDGARFSADGVRNLDHFTYITDFASYDLCKRFAGRRCFAHCNINFLD